MSETHKNRVAAVIVAAGRGTRAGGEIPKQWQQVAGRRVIDWTLAAFRTHPAIDEIVVVVHPDDVERLADEQNLIVVQGGDSRSQSVSNGLRALEKNAPDAVLIHDAARACVSSRVISNVIDALDQFVGAAPGLAVSDALWSGDDTVSGVVDRSGLFRAQTPQGFRFAQILAAHRNAPEDAQDDVAVARAFGIDVAITKGDPDNIKITVPADFERAERIFRSRVPMTVRIGNGYDVHRFGDGDHVTLCGVDVPHSRSLQGHSDADVGMHAVTDAIYGALAEGDIGQHFPPSDPQWKGAASEIFLRHAVELATSKGFAISNVDCTLVCEFPKIGPHANSMRERMAEIMGLPADTVSVKATTSERLGFTGREEGIASIATVTLVRT
ncbi:MAG: bifunctional 2-C-methyl-D-erythritol 4-phosphate cytidylyltransferase/2-C-methyl-D-erythritol 2,4-cyclodiphosphate synthase [Boseongicola sp.]|nr:bifunctional 2-C-methyl-D-erythritol 4-phosphate cytidylyltransferase/2-C-methyl-D-erythritol 2,4-cyclodiphosphate synthase [Boseongicola sp.]MDD9978378.1 bifunctional 2-C-methyl-D-erythritol 4-phosphate cytidylyltransferase/2-C-methyl-D-erythritol 2,4-cyclodiphosphate synthase [Boseongicola sp.]